MQKSNIDNAVRLPVILVLEAHPRQKDCHVRPSFPATSGDHSDWHDLVNENLILVESRLPHIHGINENNRDDVLQAGRLALCRAAKGYKSGLGTEFSTYAVTAIDRAMHREILAGTDKNKPVSMQELVAHDYDTNLVLEDVTAADERTTCPAYLYEQKEAAHTLPSLIETFPINCRTALQAMQLRSMGFKRDEIIKKLNMCKNPSTYRGTLYKARQKLKADPVFMSLVEGMGHQMNTSA